MNDSALGPVSDKVNEVSRAVVDAVFQVHKELGPGLLERVYEVCLLHELGKRCLKVDSQIDLPVFYDGVKLDAGLRVDLIVEEKLLVELKSVEVLHPVYKAQVLSYLRLTGLRLGLLVNFNVPVIRDGIKRIIL